MTERWQLKPYLEGLRAAKSAAADWGNSGRCDAAVGMTSGDLAGIVCALLDDHSTLGRWDGATDRRPQLWGAGATRGRRCPAVAGDEDREDGWARGWSISWLYMLPEGVSQLREGEGERRLKPSK